MTDFSQEITEKNSAFSYHGTESGLTINKYNDYQNIDKQTTNKRQTNDNIIIKNNKNNTKKEINNKESISKDIPKITGDNKDLSNSKYGSISSNNFKKSVL